MRGNAGHEGAGMRLHSGIGWLYVQGADIGRDPVRQRRKA
jgi:hypothetical protein